MLIFCQWLATADTTHHDLSGRNSSRYCNMFTIDDTIIEVFFKRMKQHLRLKVFYGILDNADKTQIGVAICVYLIVEIVKMRLKIDSLLYTFL